MEMVLRYIFCVVVVGLTSSFETEQASAQTTTEAVRKAYQQLLEMPVSRPMGIARYAGCGRSAKQQYSADAAFSIIAPPSDMPARLEKPRRMLESIIDANPLIFRGEFEATRFCLAASTSVPVARANGSGMITVNLDELENWSDGSVAFILATELAHLLLYHTFAATELPDEAVPLLEVSREHAEYTRWRMPSREDPADLFRTITISDFHRDRAIAALLFEARTSVPLLGLFEVPAYVDFTPALQEIRLELIVKYQALLENRTKLIQKCLTDGDFYYLDKVISWPAEKRREMEEASRFALSVLLDRTETVQHALQTLYSIDPSLGGAGHSEVLDWHDTYEPDQLLPYFDMSLSDDLTLEALNECTMNSEQSLFITVATDSVDSLGGLYGRYLFLLKRLEYQFPKLAVTWREVEADTVGMKLLHRTSLGADQYLEYLETDIIPLEVSSAIAPPDCRQTGGWVTPPGILTSYATRCWTYWHLKNVSRHLEAGGQ